MGDQGSTRIEPSADTSRHANGSLNRVGRWIKQVEPHYAISGVEDAATYLIQRVYKPFAEFPQEEFVVLLLDSQHSVRYEITLYRGTINCALIRIAEVFREAIRLNAFALVVAHNHPSGNATPSLEDIKITQSLQKAGHLLEIPVLDHFVIGNNQWTSLQRSGAFTIADQSLYNRVEGLPDTYNRAPND